jgi:formylglycine-generating enzyme required for sulfatase activity
MVTIPAGSFKMGSPADEPERLDDEGPQHRVKVAAFELGKTEVTVAQYRAFTEATNYRTEAEISAGSNKGCLAWLAGEKGVSYPADLNWRNPGIVQGKDDPVVCLSWNDAQAYVRWLSRDTGERWRLPTEAEWEYAARAGTTTPFSTGACITTRQANYNGNFDYKDCGAKTGVYVSKTQPVGSYPANPWGLHDLPGNVWEWVEDCYHDSYQGAPTDGSAWTQGACPARVVRGGSWYGSPRVLRSAFRGRSVPGSRVSNDVGFRVARTLTP